MESPFNCPECKNKEVTFYELEPTEDDTIEQEAECPLCGCHWRDIFTFSERRMLAKKEIPTI